MHTLSPREHLLLRRNVETNHLFLVSEVKLPIGQRRDSPALTTKDLYTRNLPTISSHRGKNHLMLQGKKLYSTAIGSLLQSLIAETVTLAILPSVFSEDLGSVVQQSEYFSRISEVLPHSDFFKISTS